MSKTFDQSKDEIARLCQYFTTNRKPFLASGVKEAHIRQSLIDPFFEILGWDMRNAAMVTPQFREVVTEDSLDIEGQQKAPDYTFRLGTLPKYYVEAKKCGINISADPAPAYQLRRYGFSAKLPLSILTDFEELGVYDCASRPRPGDKASHGRIQYFEFAEYPDRWREIWDIFSREAIWSGAFDQYAASKRKRGTSEVDSEFLKDIEGWRDSLARNIALRNLYLDHNDLNNAVQRTIDRIIFLRMAEDRKLETYGQLLKICDQPEIYSRFMKLCLKADEKYNSGIFHFQKEAGVSEEQDRLTPALAIDDKVLKPILQSLYFEHGCPYHFGVLPVEILGTVYERFLGKVIRLTAGHQAKVEEKPEVRKAGGVYYTPAYIVNYIVLNTVGKQIEGKPPSDLAGSKTKPPFRVLDMACGSGSFLLGAYQYLLDHCLKWYQANPSKKNSTAVYENAKGETCLSIAERKRILITHIFGVDIDRQAVETTKLSLLLKALEGENDTTLSKQMALFHERALPNLSNNIKCGNSLIASDFSMHPEDLIRVNAFDWPAQFPEAMKAGGFDAIIGNPPYITYSLGRGRLKSADADIDYIAQKYASSSEYKINSFAIFYERALSLCRDKGICAYIVPGTILINQALHKIRHHLLTDASLWRIVSLYYRVFADAEMGDCAILFVDKNKSDKYLIELIRYNAENWVANWSKDEVTSDAILAMPDARMYMNKADYKILSLANKTLLQPLDKVVKFYNGIKTGDNKKYLSDKKSSPKHIPVLRGRDFERYGLARPSTFVYFDSSVLWSNTDETKLGVTEKIVIRQTGDTLTATLDKNGVFCMDTVHMIYESLFDMRFLIGLLNSHFLNFYHSCLVPEFGKAFAEVKIANLGKLPVPIMQLSKPTDKAHYDKLIMLVDKMLTLIPNLHAAKSESEKAALQNAVTTTDGEIDRLVYELYGLTEEEIKIVEGE